MEAAGFSKMKPGQVMRGIWDVMLPVVPCVDRVEEARNGYSM